MQTLSRKSCRHCVTLIFSCRYTFALFLMKGYNHLPLPPFSSLFSHSLLYKSESIFSTFVFWEQSFDGQIRDLKLTEAAHYSRQAHSSRPAPYKCLTSFEHLMWRWIWQVTSSNFEWRMVTTPSWPWRCDSGRFNSFICGNVPLQRHECSLWVFFQV